MNFDKAERTVPDTRTDEGDTEAQSHAASVVETMREVRAEQKRLDELMSFAREVGFFEMHNQSGTLT